MSIDEAVTWRGAVVVGGAWHDSGRAVAVSDMAEIVRPHPSTRGGAMDGDAAVGRGDVVCRLALASAMGACTFQCPTDSCRNDRIPEEWHRNPQEWHRNPRNPQEWDRNPRIPQEWYRNGTGIRQGQS